VGTAEYRTVVSSPLVEGAFLRADGIARFAGDLRALHSSLRGTAELDGHEPDLHVLLSGDGRGHVEAVVTMQRLVPRERHEYRTELDPTDVLDAARACDDILERFPVRGRIDEHRE
jgi:hypothetical protein